MWTIRHNVYNVHISFDVCNVYDVIHHVGPLENCWGRFGLCFVIDNHVGANWDNQGAFVCAIGITKAHCVGPIGSTEGHLGSTPWSSYFS